MSEMYTSARKHTRSYLMDGLRRVRTDFFQSLQITVAGIGAYFFALYVLGHQEPIFAATAAIVSLGYVSGATHSRRILEVSLGVSCGILVGELLLMGLGPGLLQAAIALFISVLIARFLNNGIIFTIQMSTQSCLVILLPPTSNLPLTRSLDGLVGGIAAFLMMFLMPKDPRSGPRERAKELMQGFSETFAFAAGAMRDYSPQKAAYVLERSRGLQELYEACHGDLVTARGMAQISWSGKKSRRELKEFAQTLTAIDLAIRNTRVLNRRMSSTINHVQLRRPAIDTLAGALDELSLAVQSIGLGMYSKTESERRHYMASARQRLKGIAQRLDPAIMHVKTFEAESLVLMLRPLTVDLLEATGMEHDDAVATLVTLGKNTATEHAPRTASLRIVNPDEQRPDTDAADTEETQTRALNIVLRSQEEL